MGKEHAVLLVEDRNADARLVMEAFRMVDSKCTIDCVKDGVEALEYLSGKGAFKGKKMPDLILLDIKLPRMDGKELLKEIKSSVTLRDIPVVMLTNSDTKEDIMESYEHQANSYITKPVALSDLVETAKYIEELWLGKK